jgi:hypothetical protein
MSRASSWRDVLHNGYRNAATVNSLRLLDSYKNFVDLQGRHDHPQASQKGSRPAVSYFKVLKARDRDLREEIQNEAPGPVQVEVYPDHEDFAVRTLGMPGLGALGVTFGEVVAMDSPSAASPATSTGPARCGTR